MPTTLCFAEGELPVQSSKKHDQRDGDQNDNWGVYRTGLSAIDDNWETDDKGKEQDSTENANHKRLGTKPGPQYNKRSLARHDEERQLAPLGQDA
ncbi:MAG: hypothetical protein QGG36_15580 [Pirellulaceae bacterium]|nr:hypothetical protein [Pirellulaceae bacterium]